MGCILNSVTEAKDKCAPETGLRAFPTVQTMPKEKYQLLHFQSVPTSVERNTICFLPAATFSGSHVFPLRGLSVTVGDIHTLVAADHTLRFF